MSEINHHDAIVKEVLSQKEYAVELLQRRLPAAVSRRLDFSKLRREPGSFIDAAGRERFADLLFSIPFRKSRGKLGVYLLCEHKSRPDKNIHRQLLSYIAAIYRNDKVTFPIIPLVLYHGRQTWDIPVNFASILEIPPKMREFLSKYLPDFQYQIFDLAKDEEELLSFSAIFQSFLYSLKEIWYLEDPRRLETLFRERFAPLL